MYLKRKNSLNWLFFFFFSVILMGQPASNAATLIHSNDGAGELEPCGCRSNPKGGVARKLNWMRRIKDPFKVQVDAGDVLFPTQVIPELLQEQSFVQAQFLLQAMEAMGHDVIVPGEKDFALGLAKFLKLRKKTKIKFLAMNLLVRKTGKPLLSGYEVISGKNGSGKTERIGVFGVVGEGLEYPSSLKVSSPFLAAKRAVTILKAKKVDSIVAVSHLGDEGDRELAKKVPGIDVIVGGHSQSFFQIPEKVRKTYLLQSSLRNQYVGAWSLQKPLDPKIYQLDGLDAGYDSSESKPNPVDRIVTQFKAAIHKLNLKQDEALEAKLGALVEGKYEKFHTFPRCAECHLPQFDFWRKTTHARALNSLVEKKQAANKECLTCHTVGLGDPNGFSQVAHLAKLKVPADKPGDQPTEKAIELEKLNALLNGIAEESELKDTFDSPFEGEKEISVLKAVERLGRTWTPVQCENCHQPGRGHPFAGNYSKSVDKDRCLKCHTPARAPEWYEKSGEPKWDLITTKRRMITCPAGDITVLDANE